MERWGVTDMKIEEGMEAVDLGGGGGAGTGGLRTWHGKGTGRN